jgi:hypothetical protein
MKLEDFNIMLKRLFSRLDKVDNFEQYFAAAGRIRTAEYIALELWKKNLSEDDDTKILRERINHLHECGEWDFE